MLPHTYLLGNKIKELSFKIIHKYYPANHYMKKFKENKLKLYLFVITTKKRVASFLALCSCEETVARHP